MLTPRDYQRAAVDAVYGYFETATGNPLVVLPTGSGKSVVCAMLLQEILAAWPAQRILVVTHVRELIEQNYHELLGHWPEAPAGVYSAGLRSRDLEQPITFAGIQSLYRIDTPPPFDLVIIDECHLVPADGEGMYRTLLENLRRQNPRAKVIGLTATPYRLNSGPLVGGGIFTDIAYELPLSILIAQGHLAPITTAPVRERVNLEAVRIKAGEFKAGELEAAMLGDKLVDRIVAEANALAADRHSWLVFASGVAHARALTNALGEGGIAAAMVTGETGDFERERTIDRFRKGQYRALVNVSVLTTGFNVRQIDCLILARPTMSPGLYLQMLGRGMRTADGKVDCLVLDYGGNVQRHGPADQVRSPVRREKGEGEAPSRICPECGAKMHASAAYCGDCGKEFPRDPEKNLSARASSASVLAAESISTVAITRVVYSRHAKPEGKPSLRVDYYAGFNRVASEWVCFEHVGYARQKAVAWWTARTDQGATPSTVLEAVQRQKELRTPDEIIVSFAEKWPRVIRAKFTEKEHEHRELPAVA